MISIWRRRPTCYTRLSHTVGRRSGSRYSAAADACLSDGDSGHGTRAWRLRVGWNSRELVATNTAGYTARRGGAIVAAAESTTVAWLWTNDKQLSPLPSLDVISTNCYRSTHDDMEDSFVSEIDRGRRRVGSLLSAEKMQYLWNGVR